ncbi:MAG: hypothetical protein MHM6MM_003469 [Cercozoa sp. M6MM]
MSVTPQGLGGVLSAILEAGVDNDRRRVAEQEMEKMKVADGFCAAALQLMADAANNNSATSATALLLLATQIKLVVQKRWRRQRLADGTVVGGSMNQADRQAVKQAVVPAVVAFISHRELSSLMLYVFEMVVREDRPWDGLVEALVGMLNEAGAKGDISQMTAALALLRRIFKIHQFASVRLEQYHVPRDQFVSAVLPIVLQLLAQTTQQLQQALAGGQHAQAEPMARLAFLALTSLDMATSTYVPVFLRQPAELAKLCDTLRAFVQLPLPRDTPPQGHLALAVSEAFSYLFRPLFQMYGAPQFLQDGKDQEMYGGMAKYLFENQVPQNLAVLMQMLLATDRSRFLVDRTVRYAAFYALFNAVGLSALWKHLKPHAGALVDAVFNECRLTEEDVRRLEESPAEYLEEQEQDYSDSKDPTLSAGAFLLHAVKVRSADFVNPVLQRIGTTVNQESRAGQCDLSRRLQRAAAFHVISFIATPLVDSRNEQLKTQVMSLLKQELLPEISHAPEVWMRARALLALQKLAVAQWHRESDGEAVCQHIFQHIMGALLPAESPLPVRVAAALCAGRYVICNWFREMLVLQEQQQSGLVARVVRAFIELSNELTSEKVMDYLEVLIQQTGEHLAQATIDLAQHAAQEIQNLYPRVLQLHIAPDADFDCEDDERLRHSVALLVQLVYAAHEKLEILTQLENIIVPLFTRLFLEERRTVLEFVSTTDVCCALLYFRKVVHHQPMSPQLREFVYRILAYSKDCDLHLSMLLHVAPVCENWIAAEDLEQLGQPNSQASAIFNIAMTLLMEEVTTIGDHENAISGNMRLAMQALGRIVAVLAPHSPAIVKQLFPRMVLERDAFMEALSVRAQARAAGNPVPSNEPQAELGEILFLRELWLPLVSAMLFLQPVETLQLFCQSDAARQSFTRFMHYALTFAGEMQSLSVSQTRAVIFAVLTLLEQPQQMWPTEIAVADTIGAVVAAVARIVSRDTSDDAEEAEVPDEFLNVADDEDYVDQGLQVHGEGHLIDMSENAEFFEFSDDEDYEGSDDEEDDEMQVQHALNQTPLLPFVHQKLTQLQQTRSADFQAFLTMAQQDEKLTQQLQSVQQAIQQQQQQQQQ